MDGFAGMCTGWRRGWGRAAAAAVAALALPVLAVAQAIAVPASQTGLFGGRLPATMSFLFESADARATLIFIPGGEGRIGIQDDWTADHPRLSTPQYLRMLRTLTDPTMTSGRTHVVIVDSPMELPRHRGWSVARTAPDHLSRVEDVLRFYALRLGKPVWLMGHSAGAISITEVYKRLQLRGQGSLVAGLVFSAGVRGASFAEERTRLPVLVLHHARDACVNAQAADAMAVHAKLQAGGDRQAELVLLRTGHAAPPGSDPCATGFHMYLGASVEAARTIDAFLNRRAAST